MSARVYAMDTAFYHSIGAYEFDARCEMLRELGYDATYLTLWSPAAWADLDRVPHVQATYGLEVAGVYAGLDVSAPFEDARNQAVVALLQRLEGCRTVEVPLAATTAGLAPSDPAGRPEARRWLEHLLPLAEQRDLTIALYPHRNTWLERVEDAVWLCRALAHERLRLVFPAFHWYAVDGTDLRGRIAEAAPYLHSVNLCGARRLRDGTVTIEPLDEGELDTFALLGLLREVGYQGMVGIQGYSVGGDVYAKLRRSLAALRDMEDRLDRHPAWARLRPPRH